MRHHYLVLTLLIAFGVAGIAAVSAMFSQPDSSDGSVVWSVGNENVLFPEYAQACGPELDVTDPRGDFDGDGIRNIDDSCNCVPNDENGDCPVPTDPPPPTPTNTPTPNVTPTPTVPAPPDSFNCYIYGGQIEFRSTPSDETGDNITGTLQATRWYRVDERAIGPGGDLWFHTTNAPGWVNVFSVSARQITDRCPLRQDVLLECPADRDDYDNSVGEEEIDTLPDPVRDVLVPIGEDGVARPSCDEIRDYFHPDDPDKEVGEPPYVIGAAAMSCPFKAIEASKLANRLTNIFPEINFNFPPPDSNAICTYFDNLDKFQPVVKTAIITMRDCSQADYSNNRVGKIAHTLADIDYENSDNGLHTCQTIRRVNRVVELTPDDMVVNDALLQCSQFESYQAVDERVGAIWRLRLDGVEVGQIVTDYSGNACNIATCVDELRNDTFVSTTLNCAIYKGDWPDIETIREALAALAALDGITISRDEVDIIYENCGLNLLQQVYFKRDELSQGRWNRFFNDPSTICASVLDFVSDGRFGERSTPTPIPTEPTPGSTPLPTPTEEPNTQNPCDLVPHGISLVEAINAGCVPDGLAVFIGVDANGNQDIYMQVGYAPFWQRVTNTPDIDEEFPALSPDGKKIATVIYDDRFDEYQIMVYEYPESLAQPQSIVQPDRTIVFPAGLLNSRIIWLDESHLLFTATTTDNETGMVVFNVDGSRTPLLSRTRNPSISPGSLLAFEVILNGETFVEYGPLERDDNGYRLGSTALIARSKGCRNPVFGPENTRVLYMVCDDNQIVKVDIQDGTLSDQEEDDEYEIVTINSDKPTPNINNLVVLDESYLMYDDGETLYIIATQTGSIAQRWDMDEPIDDAVRFIMYMTVGLYTNS